VEIHSLRNRNGFTVRFIPLGGIIVAIEAPDRNGRFDNVVLGFRDTSDYLTQKVFFGAVCGRYANRIAGARFALDGVEYRLAPTDGTSSVHGGRTGFDKAVWSVERVAGEAAILRHTSPDGEEGYPGNLAVEMRYSVGEDDSFTIDYSATTDRPTIVNLTNHSYFNLRGEGAGSILDHRLMIAAERYTPADAILIPTGEIAEVAYTPFDFRRPVAIGDRIRVAHPQMIAGKGYDLNYIVDGTPGTLRFAARVEDPASGRFMELRTTEPGIQLYTGNLLDGTITGPSGRLYRQSDALCLEPHHYPNSPNEPRFPSPVLRPGATYRSKSVYSFGTDRVS
jgi:aldose 1-epimerase